MPSPILVSSAAGLTGGLVTRLLLERGHSVRALVRRLDERANLLQTLGAEVVQGDLLDPVSMAAAFAGVRRAYFAYPVQDGLLEATAIFASAARNANTEIVVNLSQLQNSNTPGSHRNQRHILADQIFEWAKVGAVNLQATMFYNVIRNFTQQSVATQNAIYLPLGAGDALIPLMAADDVARVAASLLDDPPKAKASAYSLVGDLLTVRELVTTFTNTLGRPISYVDLPDEQWRKAVEGFVDPYVLDHLAGVFKFFRTADTQSEQTFEVGSTIASLIGQPPQKFGDFILANREAFGGVHELAQQ